MARLRILLCIPPIQARSTAMALLLLIAAACNKKDETPAHTPAAPSGGGPYAQCEGPTTVTDVDGNTYPVVRIGGQCWMAQNLRTTKYRDGSAIPEAGDDDTWQTTTNGAWCNYANDHANDGVYGKFYNWYAITDARNICPEGWHVPTHAEWTALADHLGGMAVAGGKLKSTSSLWDAPNVGATNETGFAALPSGFRTYYNSQYAGAGCWLWGGPQGSPAIASSWTVVFNHARLGVNPVNPSAERFGHCLRCIRD